MSRVKKTKQATSENYELPRPNNQLQELGGSAYELVNNTRAAQVLQTVWTGTNLSAEDTHKAKTAALLTLAGMKPSDDVEGQMVAQMVATHHATMECFRRAMIPEQGFDARFQNLAFANKLTRAYTQQVESLQRYRGKGQQKVTVEHVHVHAGGQAIVGTVEQAGGGTEKKLEEQPHAKQVTHAPVPEMPCPDTARELVPIPRDAKR